MSTSKEARMRELEQYLYSDLGEIVAESDDEAQAAYMVVLVIAFHEKKIDPIRLDFYTSHLPLAKDRLSEAFAYFCGAEFLEVEELDDKFKYAYEAGKEGKRINSPLYQVTATRISEFHNEFWTNW